MTFGEEIKQARERKNLSQEDLAERLGVSRQAVSKWENNASVPQGANRELLSQLLDLEAAAEEPPAPKRSALAWLGWVAAAAALAVLAVVWLRRGSPAVPGGAAAEIAPTVRSVRFYDAAQAEVHDEALWYDSARIESILIQWEGGTPESIRMLFVPAGSNMLEQTELLLTKAIPDGDCAIVLNADTLAHKPEGHIYFELNFGTSVVTSDTYHLYYGSGAGAPLTTDGTTTLAYIKEFDGISLAFDAAEWVSVPSERAAELGISDSGSGFFIHNADPAIEEYPLAADCVCTVLDWSPTGGGTYEPMGVSAAELQSILDERAAITVIPYHLTIQDGQIIEIREQYIP